jgi:transposase
MSDRSDRLRLEVVSVLRNSRRRYDPASKQRLVEACLQPDVSVAGLALRHGVNANLLRKWVAAHRQRQSNGAAAGVVDRAAKAFVPVVELCGVTGAPEPPAPPPLQHPVRRAKPACRADLPGPRLTVEMPNGVTLRLECGLQDVELVTAMIVTLGRCDVPVGR